MVGKREQSALWDLLGHNATYNRAVATLDANSLWCDGPGAKRVRRGCEDGHAGCAHDYFFCHVPHLGQTEGSRFAALAYERGRVEAAALRAARARARGRRLLRGRAIQNIMYAGMERRLELIQELRLEAEEKAMHERMKMKLREWQVSAKELHIAVLAAGLQVPLRPSWLN